MTVNAMRETLKKLFTDKGAKAIIAEYTCEDGDKSIKNEPVETFYSGYSHRGGRGRGSMRSGRYFRGGRGSRQGNPTDYSGNVSKCFTCGSEMHWARDCPNGFQRGRGSGRHNSNDNYLCEN